MIRRWQAWVVFIFAAVIAPVCASADVPVNTWSGAITGTGVLFQFNLSGASSCQVKVTGSPSGLTAAVQTSADQFGAAGWDTASATVGSASITTASNNIFNVAGSGLVGFRVNVSAYTSGTTNLWAACSAAVSHATSGTVTGVTATAPITSSGGTAPNIALTTPLATTFGGTGTASPGLVAGTNITLTGSWPNNTINATATGYAGLYSPPTTAAFPTIITTNAITPTIANGTQALVYTTAVHNGDTIVGALANIPGTNWTATLRMLVTFMPDTNLSMGILCTDGTKYAAYGMEALFSSTQPFQYNRWTNATTFSAHTFTLGTSTNPIRFVEYIKLQNDGTNMLLSISYDGVNWNQIQSESKTAWFAGQATQCGIGGDASDTVAQTQSAYMSVLYWTFTTP